MVLIQDLISQQTVVTLNTKDTVKAALEKLDKNKITAAPLLNEEGKVCGFVDVVDLCLHLIKVATEERSSTTTPASTRLTSDDIGMITKRSSEFFLSSLLEAINKGQARHDAYFPLRMDQTLKEVVPIFLHGVHRVAVTDNSNKIVSVLTQSNLIRFLNQDHTRMGIKAHEEVSKLPLVQKEVVSVEQSVLAIDAFVLMRNKQVTSLAVVDRGVLVGTLTATDLKGLNEFHFPRLLLPISEFVAIIRKDQGRPADFVVKCGPQKELCDVVKLLESQHVHHLFIVDDQNRPLKVVAMTDIIQAIWGDV